MTFLHPALAITAAALVAVPIIIHILMRRRRRPFQWAAMRFLLEAYRRQRRRLQLEQLLLLLTRCLVVLLIGLALGRPLLEAAGLIREGGGRTIYLVIDNSLASTAIDERGVSAIERHKALADEILAAIDVGDRAGLIAVGAPAERVITPPAADIGSVRRAIENLQPTDSRADFAGGLDMLKADIAAENSPGSVVVAMLSDWTAGSADLDQRLPEIASRAARVRVLASPAAEASTQNVAVHRVEPLRSVLIGAGPVEDGVRPDIRTEQVRVTLARHGDAGSEATTRARVLMNDEAGQPVGVGERTLTWARGQTEQTTAIPIELPATQGQVALIVETQSAGDAIPPDGIFRRPIEIRTSLRVGLIAPRRFGQAEGLDPTRSEDWLRLALRPEIVDRELFARGFEGDIELALIDPASIDSARLAGLDALFIVSPHLVDSDGWKRARMLADRGGLVVVIPPAGVASHVWTDEMLGAMQLPWTTSREAAASSAGASLLPPAPDQGTHARLLELLMAELDVLVRPVRVFEHLRIENAPPVLPLDTGEPFIVASRPGDGERGLVVMFAASLSVDWTNLPTQPLFVALVHELLHQGIGSARGNWTLVAGVQPVLPDGVSELVPVGEGEVVRVDDAGRALSPMRHAGVWQARDRLGVPRTIVCINPDPAGSRTDASNPGAVAAWLATLGDENFTWITPENEPPREVDGRMTRSIGSILSSNEQGAGISLPLLLAGLTLLLVELALARWFSHALNAPAAEPSTP